MKVIVTGGSSGIGECIKKDLVERDYTVYDFSRKNEIDITDRKTVIREIDKIDKVDLFIHCAGYNKPVIISEIDRNYEDWKKHFEINYLSFVFIVSYLIDKKKLTNGATIVALSSRSADLTRKGWSGYCSSKAALNSFIRNFAEEYKDIRIFGVSPSKVYTSMIKELYPNIEEEDCWDPREISGKILLIVDNVCENGKIYEMIKG